MPRKISMPKGSLGPNFVRKVLPWIELFWHSHKRFPTDTELSAEFGFDSTDLLRLKGSKYLKECLKSRGIRMTDDFFSEKQVAAIALITNFADTRPVNAKLSGIGVTSEMYNGWLQDPKFKRELAARADDILENVYPEATAALAKKVRSGDMNALKFYFEITGRASSPEAINVKMMMARLIEAVEKHVKDPEILALIANEIRAVGPVAEVPTTPIPSTKMKYAKHLESANNGN